MSTILDRIRAGQDEARLLAAMKRAAPWFRSRVGEKAGQAGALSGSEQQQGCEDGSPHAAANHQSSTALTITLALVPPKPKLLDRTLSMLTFHNSLQTSSPRVLPTRTPLSGAPRRKPSRASAWGGSNP